MDEFLRAYCKYEGRIYKTQRWSYNGQFFAYRPAFKTVVIGKLEFSNVSHVADALGMTCYDTWQWDRYYLSAGVVWDEEILSAMVARVFLYDVRSHSWGRYIGWQPAYPSSYCPELVSIVTQVVRKAIPVHAFFDFVSEAGLIHHGGVDSEGLLQEALSCLPKKVMSEKEEYQEMQTREFYEK